MKKSMMMAVSAAVMLMSASALANEYPLTHPFYTPDKGQGISQTAYRYSECKAKSNDAKGLLGFKKIKSNRENEDYAYGLTNKWTLDLGYEHFYDKGKGKMYPEVSDDDVKTTSWYIGFSNKMVDNGKTFLKGSFDYFQRYGDVVENGQDKGFDLAVLYGVKGGWADPYVRLQYTNTINRGSDNDGTGEVLLGFYKQFSRKFASNLAFSYSQSTDRIKDKYTEASLDFRYAFTAKQALILGFATQLADDQKSQDIVLATGTDKVNFKSKSRNRVFVSYVTTF